MATLVILTRAGSLGNSICPVSTVLRPVGPRQPRVYWGRRLVLLAIVAVVIFAIVEACSGGGGGGGSGQPNSNHSTPPTTPATTPPASTQVAACDPSVLSLALSTDQTTYTSGDPVQLIGTFTNPGATACTLEVSEATEFWTVKSGPVKIWTTKGCVSASATSKKVKIKAGGTHQVTTTWPGNRIGTTPCSDGEVALAGEYTADGTLDGVTAPRAAVFHITS